MWLCLCDYTHHEMIINNKFSEHSSSDADKN